MLGFSIGVLGALALGAAQDTSREVVTPAALKAVVKDYRKAQQAEFAKLPDLAKLEGARFKLTIPFGKYARNARYEYDKQSGTLRLTMGVASYFPPQNYPHVIFDEDSAEVDRFEAGNAYGARATVKQVEMITYAVGFRDSEAAPEEVDINVMLKAELPLGPAEAQAVSASARVVLEGELDLQGAEPVLCRAKYHGARVDSPVVVTGSDCIVFTRLTSAKIVTGGKASRVVASWRRAANASD